MATNSNGEALIEALSETSAAIIERVKAGNERAHRISTSLIKGGEWVSQESLALGRSFLQEPTDVAGLAGAAFQKAGEAQDHAFAFLRDLIDEVATGARENRTTAERIYRANTSAGQAAVEAARGLATRTTEALRPEFLRAAVEPVTRSATRSRRAASEEAA